MGFLIHWHNTIIQYILNWPLPIGAFQGQWNTTKRRNRTTTVKNPNWPEASKLAIYKCSWEVEPGTTRIKFNKWSGRVLNPGSLDLKASALTTRPHCLPHITPIDCLGKILLKLLSRGYIGDHVLRILSLDSWREMVWLGIVGFLFSDMWRRNSRSTSYLYESSPSLWWKSVLWSERWNYILPARALSRWLEKHVLERGFGVFLSI